MVSISSRKQKVRLSSENTSVKGGRGAKGWGEWKGFKIAVGNGRDD